jgi:hypothetical protein
METYAKLSSNLVTSSLWCTETLEAKVLWVTMLAMKDKHGIVSATIPGLAQMAGIPIVDCEEAIKRFQEPDKYSRTQDFDGRRIEAVDGGWILLNHKRYRDELQREAKRKADRERIAAKRAADRESREPRDSTQRDSCKVSQSVADVAHTDTDTDTDIHPLPHAGDPPIVPQELKAIWQQWSGYILESQGRRIGSYEAEQCLKALSYRGPDKAARDVEFSILKGAKSLLDSDDDFSKQRAQRASGGRRGREAIDVDGLEL